jgi:SAM-dependent methyltransferase
MPVNFIRRLDRWGLLQPGLAVLGKLRLLPFAYRQYGRLVALTTDAPPPVSPSELPIPPRDLIFQVAGSVDAQWYLDCGRAMFDAFAALLAARGHQLADLRAVLDFGCGCGRVLRCWHDVRGPVVHGTDYNRAMSSWCRDNLPFAQVGVNSTRPPLSYADSSFDCVYAVSVFTHLSAVMQQPWLEELARVLEPGGFLLLTTQGTNFRSDLDDDERERFDRGELVVRYHESSGTNLCGVYHPENWLRDHVGPLFSICDFIPAGTRAGVGQDIYLLQKN